jgi:UDPglucose 6-dehydrogenase
VIETLKQLHKPLKTKVIVVKPESAQMSKYAANAYLALRITFINQIANLCEHNGADIQEVIEAMGPDKRIGEHYWYPGLGYGGSCFPKDVKELAAYSKSVNENNNLLIKIDELNEERIDKLLAKFSKKVGGFKDKNITVLGLSFKPNTDDIREAPALKVVPKLISSGAKVTGYDPKVGESIKDYLSGITIASDLESAITGADVVILLVEWSEFVNMDLDYVASKMKGNILIDTRNQFDKQTALNAGLEYLGVGR